MSSLSGPTFLISSSDSSNSSTNGTSAASGGPVLAAPDGVSIDAARVCAASPSGLSSDTEEHWWQEGDHYFGSHSAPEGSGGPAGGAAVFWSHQQQLLTIVRDFHRQHHVPDQLLVPAEVIAQLPELVVARYGPATVIEVLPTRDVDIINTKMLGDLSDLVLALCGLFRLRRFMDDFCAAGVPQLLRHPLLPRIFSLCSSDSLHLCDAAWRTLSQIAIVDARFCDALLAAPALLRSLVCLVQCGGKHCGGASGCELCPSHPQYAGKVTAATSHIAFSCPLSRCGPLRLLLALAVTIDLTSVFRILDDMSPDALLASVVSGLRITGTGNREFACLAAHLVDTVSLSLPSKLAAVPGLALACADVLRAEESTPIALDESKRLLAHAFSRVGLALDPALHDMCSRIVAHDSEGSLSHASSMVSGASRSSVSFLSDTGSVGPPETRDVASLVPLDEEGIDRCPPSLPPPLLPGAPSDTVDGMAIGHMSIATLSRPFGDLAGSEVIPEFPDPEPATALGDGPELTTVSEILSFVDHIYDTSAANLLPQVFLRLCSLPRDATGNPSPTLFLLCQYGFVNIVYRILSAAEESVGASLTGPTSVTHRFLFTDSRTQTALCKNGFLEVLLLWSLRVRGTVWLQQAAGLHLLSALCSQCIQAQRTLRRVYSVMLIPHIQFRLAARHAGVVFQAVCLLLEFIRGNPSNQRLLSSQLKLGWLHNFLCPDDEHAFPSRPSVPDISSPLPTSSSLPPAPSSSSSILTSSALPPPPPPDLYPTPPVQTVPPVAYGDDAAAIRSAVINFLRCVTEKQLALAILQESVHQQSVLDRLWALVRTPFHQSSVAPELALWNLLLCSQLVDTVAHVGVCEPLQQSFSSLRRPHFVAEKADVTIIMGIGDCVRRVCTACFAEWTACFEALKASLAPIFMTPSSSLSNMEQTAAAAGGAAVAITATGGGDVVLAPPSSDTGTHAAAGDMPVRSSSEVFQTESFSTEKHPSICLDPSVRLYNTLVTVVHDRVRTFLTMPGSVRVPNVLNTESVVWEVLAQHLGLYPVTSALSAVSFNGKVLVELMWSLNRTLPGLAIELIFLILTAFPALLSSFGRTGGVGYSLQALCSPSPRESDFGVQVLSLLVRHSQRSKEVFALLLRVVDCDKLAQPFIVTRGAPARNPEIVSLALETLTTLFRTCPGSGNVFQRFPRFVGAIQAAADPANNRVWQRQARALLAVMPTPNPNPPAPP